MGLPRFPLDRPPQDLRKMKALHAEIKAVLEVVHTLDAVTLKLVKAAKQRKK